MADYDWSRVCCSATVGFPHDQFCKENPQYELNVLNAKLRTQGFVYVEQARAYQCRRGCGCLVWNTQEHMANVCTEFNPIVGT